MGQREVSDWGRPPLRRELSRRLSLLAQAQYRRGLELSKQAAQVEAAAGAAGEAGGTELPELAAFASTQRAFQAKLTHFYMAAERQRTDLETLLQLHRFCKKVSPPRRREAGSGPDTALGSARFLPQSRGLGEVLFPFSRGSKDRRRG